jgi:catechol 2,3-dioxygenase-like lactoylglutathione lyase family enzyme
MVPRIQHVSIPIPAGAEAQEQARLFYSHIWGFPEIPPPHSLAHLNVVWFQVGNTELHLFPESGGVRSLGAHFCVELADVEAMRAKLAAAGYIIEETDPIPNRPRYFCRDPFGNRVELTTILGDYAA